MHCYVCQANLTFHGNSSYEYGNEEEDEQEEKEGSISSVYIFVAFIVGIPQT